MKMLLRAASVLAVIVAIAYFGFLRPSQSPQALADLAPPVKVVKAEEPKPEVPAAVKPWLGMWQPVSIDYDGQRQMDAATGKDIRLSVVGTEYRIYFVTDFKEMTGRRLSTADLAVDDKTGTFAMTIKDGYRKGERMHGIYELKGEELRLCYGKADKPRPAKFEAPKDSGAFNEVWTRAKK